MSLWTSTSGGTMPKFVTRNSNSYITDINGTANNFSVAGITTAGAHANHASHSGWVSSLTGTGPVDSLTITAGGTLYANTNTLIFTGANTTPATGTITTNANGVITAVAITSGGTGYSSPPVVTVNTATGSGATIVATTAGRSGRVLHDCLVALPSMAT